MSEHSIDHDRYLNWSTKLQQSTTLSMSTVLLLHIQVWDLRQHMERRVADASLFFFLKHQALYKGRVF